MYGSECKSLATTPFQHQRQIYVKDHISPISKIIEFGVGKILETEKGKAALVALGLVVCGLVGGNHCAARTRDRQVQVVVVLGP